MRTFSLLVLAILGFAFVACDDDDHLGDWEKAPEFSGRLRNQLYHLLLEITLMLELDSELI